MAALSDSGRVRARGMSLAASPARGDSNASFGAAPPNGGRNSPQSPSVATVSIPGGGGRGLRARGFTLDGAPVNHSPNAAPLAISPRGGGSNTVASPRRVSQRLSRASSELLTADQLREVKENERLVALLHPTTRAKVAERFQSVESEEQCITVEQFFDMLAAIEEVQDSEGVIYAARLITKFFSEETAEFLTLAECEVIIGKFISEAQVHNEAMHALDPAQAALASSAARHVDFWTYVKSVATCRRRRRNAPNLKWVGLRSVDPKVSLLVVVGVVMALSAIAIVASMGAVYGSRAEDRHDRAVRALLAASAGHLIVAESVLNRKTREGLHKAAEQMSQPVRRGLLAQEASSRRLLANAAAHSVGFALRAQLGTIEAAHRRRASLLASLVPLLKLGDFPLLRLLPAMSRLQMRGDMAVVFEVGAGVPLVASLAIAPTAAQRAAISAGFGAMRCVAAARALPAVGVPLQVDADTDPSAAGGEAAVSTAMRLNSNAAMCIFSSTRSLASVAAVSDALLATPNVEAAFSDETGVAGVSGRPLSPLLLAAVARSVGFNDTTIRYGDALRGNATNGAESKAGFAYAWLPLSRAVLTVVVSKPVTYYTEDSAVRIADFLRPAKNSSLFLAVRSAPNASGAAAVFPEGRIIGEQTPRDMALSPHVKLALSGGSGSMLSRDGEGSPVFASFSFVPDYNVAVIAERTTMVSAEARRYLTHAVVGTSTFAVSAVNGSLAVVSGQDTRDIRRHAALRGCIWSPVQGEIMQLAVGKDTSAFCVNIPEGLSSSNIGAVVAAHESSTSLDRSLASSGYGVAVGLALTISIVFFVRVLTYRVLEYIEKDYVAYKTQIEGEKQQFSELIRDRMPSYITSRLIAGEKMICDSHPMLTFCFTDIFGFTDACKKLGTNDMVRLLAYTFMLEDAVAEFYNVHKIKTIGDAYLAVAGLEEHMKKIENDHAGLVSTDNGKKEPIPPERHQVFRMASFAVVVQQLLTRAYIHRPERTACFAELAGGATDLPPLPVLTVKIGIHTGPVIAGVVDVGRSPHFDCFGPSVNLASRMETTAPSNRIQLSKFTFETLKGLDKKNQFEFGPPRKTLVKGYGTLMCYLIRSTTLAVPNELLEKLHVDRARRKQLFSPDGGMELDEQGVSTMYLTEQSTNDGGSAMDAMSSHGGGTHESNPALLEPNSPAQRPPRRGSTRRGSFRRKSGSTTGSPEGGDSAPAAAGLTAFSAVTLAPIEKPVSTRNSSVLSGLMSLTGSNPDELLTSGSGTSPSGSGKDDSARLSSDAGSILGRRATAAPLTERESENVVVAQVPKAMRNNSPGTLRVTLLESPPPNLSPARSPGLPSLPPMPVSPGATSGAGPLSMPFPMTMPRSILAPSLSGISPSSAGFLGPAFPPPLPPLPPPLPPPR